MTTYDYEMITPPVAEIASTILNYDAAHAFTDDVLKAVLGFAQHEQNRDVYGIAHAELCRRGALGPDGADSAPCVDGCGTMLSINSSVYAVDGGSACLRCGIRRYGMSTEYLVIGADDVKPA